MKQPVYILPFVFIVLAGLLLFMPFLGSAHLFDWDEINFAESAREMIVTGNYSAVQINYEPFWEKPPLFFWLQVLSMKLFGVNEFAARFPNALCGIVTLCVIYYIGKREFKGRLSIWWVLCYIGALTPHIYFKSGIIDPVFNLFIFLSIYQFYQAARQDPITYNNLRHFLIAGIFTGLAILTKGPVALLVAMLTLFSFVAVKRFYWFFGIKQLLLYGLTLLVIASLWFLPETIKNGPWFLVEFIKYQAGLFSQNIAGHQQPFYYHTLVLLFGCFPVSFIAFAAIKKNPYYSYNENLFRTMMIVLFFVVLILFSIVKTKIVHYSSLCWLPLTFLAAYGIESVRKRVVRFNIAISLSVLLFGIVVGAALAVLPMVFDHTALQAELLPQIKDKFTVENLKIDGGWTGWEIIPGIMMVLLVIISVILLLRKRFTRGFQVLLGGMALVIFLVVILVTPKIERHTQGTAINFFESLKGKNCYVFHVGYKSYAPFFYTAVQPLKPGDSLYAERKAFLKSFGAAKFTDLTEEQMAAYDDMEKNWLLTGHIDKATYFIAKAHDQEGLNEQPQLKKLWEKGGFIAYMRVPEK